MIVDPEKELLELTRENNKILRSLRAHNRWATFSHAIYWLVIIVTSLVTYYYIQPYLVTLLKTYEQIQSTIGSFPSFGG
ncbi:MAG TPA: hypothetical protein VI953_00755 [Candidatus Paceibacterota bacterium]